MTSVTLICSNCDYKIKYNNTSLQELKKATEQNRKGGFDCPTCKKFGLRIRL